MFKTKITTTKVYFPKYRIDDATSHITSSNTTSDSKTTLERRTYFRELMKQLPVDSIDANRCEQRADTLKKILVCLYGTTESYWNKYGNVLAFEEINRKSREILLKTKDIVQKIGL